MSILTSKLGVALIGGGFIGASATGIYLVNKYLSGWGTAPATTQKEQRASDSSSETTTAHPKLSGVRCQREDGVIEEMEIVEGVQMDESLRQMVNSELKDESGKCLTSQDHSFSYY